MVVYNQRRTHKTETTLFIIQDLTECKFSVFNGELNRQELPRWKSYGTQNGQSSAASRVKRVVFPVVKSIIMMLDSN